MWGEENFQTANCNYSVADESKIDEHRFIVNSCKITCDGMDFRRLNEYSSRCSIYSDYKPIRRSDVPSEVIELLARAEAKERAQVFSLTYSGISLFAQRTRSNCCINLYLF